MPKDMIIRRDPPVVLQYSTRNYRQEACLLSFGRIKQAFFLEGSDGLGAEFHLDFFAVDDDSFELQIGLPDFFGMALAEADIIAILFACAGEVTLSHG